MGMSRYILSSFTPKENHWLNYHLSVLISLNVGHSDLCCVLDMACEVSRGKGLR
jgi:hypothetical protein